MKFIITLLLCLSCMTCFANETAYERARRGEQFIETIASTSFDAVDKEKLDELFVTMHSFGYIPHKVFETSLRGTTTGIYITWMRTYVKEAHYGM